MSLAEYFSIPVERRAAAGPDLSSAEQDRLRDQLISSLNDLPQRQFINDVDARIWVDSVLEREPDRAWWHFERLFGIGGSEIGVFLGHEEGMYHPFTTARKITESKLLRAPLEATNGDMQRGTAMEDTAQGMYRGKVEARGGIARQDLMEKMKGYYDPEHPWLVGNPDDIVEENGKIYIVDYKVPMPDQIAHYDHTGVPFYYAAQVHHYRLIAEKCGIHIDGLRLCSLDLKAWDIDERPVPYSQETTDAIIATGDKFWFDHVMVGKPANTISLKNTNTISDLELEETQVIEYDLTEPSSKTGPVALVDESSQVITTRLPADRLKSNLVEMAGLFNAWSQAATESENMRQMVQAVVADRLPVHAFPIGMDRVDIGSAKLAIKRSWHEDAVLNAVRAKLTEAGMASDKIEDVLNAPNFWSPKVYAADKLLDLLQMHMEINVSEDARFDSAVAVPSTRRVDTLMALLQDLDTAKDFDYTPLMAANQSEVKFEVNREPFSGPFADLKQETRRQLRTAIQPTITQVAQDYGVKRGLLVEERRVVEAEQAADKARQKAERQQRKDDEAARKAERQAAREEKAAAKATAPAPTPRPRRRGP